MTEASSPLAEPLERIVEQLNASTVFGEPVERGDVTLIPVAEVSVALGYGHQSGKGSPGLVAVQVQEVRFGGDAYAVRHGTKESEEEEENAEPAEPGESRATSGGARGRVRPRGYIRLSPDGVAFQDILDINRLGLAGIAMVAWSIYWLAKTIRAGARPAKQ